MLKNFHKNRCINQQSGFGFVGKFGGTFLFSWSFSSNLVGFGGIKGGFGFVGNVGGTLIFFLSNFVGSKVGFGVMGNGGRTFIAVWSGCLEVTVSLGILEEQSICDIDAISALGITDDCFTSISVASKKIFIINISTYKYSM